MDQPLQTDAAVLTAEASNFETISTSLQGVMSQVDATAGSMHGHLKGVAGIAAQAAFVRYQEAALVQKNALQEISQNIHGGGVSYDNMDSEQGAALGQTVNTNIF